MVIYEANITVEPGVVNEYSAWLKEHIREVLALEGFENAAWYVRSSDAEAAGLTDADQGGGEGTAAPERVPEGKRQWTVHYHLDGREALRRYLNEDAERLRAEAQERFEGQFTTEYRVLESRQVFSHQER